MKLTKTYCSCCYWKEGDHDSMVNYFLLLQQKTITVLSYYTSKALYRSGKLVKNRNFKKRGKAKTTAVVKNIISHLVFPF